MNSMLDIFLELEISQLQQMKNRTTEIRQDLPVYLYCQTAQRSNRAAIMLYKRGYKQVYQLKGGYRKWTGKTKSK